MAKARSSLGNARAFQQDALQFFRNLTFAGGAGYRGIAHFDLFGDYFLVNDAQLIGPILTSSLDGGAYTKEGHRYYAVMRRLLHLGLFTSEGEYHLQQRRLIQPVFQHASMARLTDAIVQAIVPTLQRWQPRAGQVVDVEQEMQRLSLEILADALVGSDLREQVRAFAACNALAEQATLQVMAWPVVPPAWVPLGPNRRLNAASRSMHAIVRSIIEQRRQTIHMGNAPDSLLTRMLQQELATQAMGAQQFQDQIVTLLVGGYQSVASALMWTWYLLATHAEVMQRLRAELTQTLAGRTPAAADVPRLTYTHMVVEESLRLYPPVWVISRVVARDDQLGGLNIPQGAQIAISPYTVHRNPAYWQQPEAFNPEHFAASHNRPQNAYLPFGIGRHKCIGNYYALAALALCLATLAPHYHFDPPDHPVELSARAFMGPRHGLRMRLQRWPA